MGILEAETARLVCQGIIGELNRLVLTVHEVVISYPQTPLESIAATFDVAVIEIGNPHYDDPSLSLLFLQLKDKSLQTVKGSSEISGRTEFNFVLQMARVFCRMGE